MFSKTALSSSVFLKNLMEDGDIAQLDDNYAAARFLADRALHDLGGVPLEGPSADGDEYLANMLTDEVLYVLSRQDAPSSLSWYTDALDRMVAVASLLHPEITDDSVASGHVSGRFKSAREARVVLFTAMALTSQNNAVFDNMRYALEQYRYFLENGCFFPKVYGANGSAVFSNLQRFNFVLNRTNGDLSRFYRLMTMELSMRDLSKVAARFDIKLGGKELADETVYGSMIFGPKVGNGFLQNLLGNHKPITIDLWFMRTWGRYTGTLVRDQLEDGVQKKLADCLRRSQRSERMCKLMEEFGVLKKPADVLEMDGSELLRFSRDLKLFWEKVRRHYTTGKLNDHMQARSAPLALKNQRDNEAASELKAKLGWPGAAESVLRGLGQPVDSPRNASIRAWMRSVCEMALSKLKDKGFEMSAANLQATLWYPEKELYGKLTGRAVHRFTTSYDDAIIEIAKKEGIDEREIETALRAVGANRAGGPAGSAGTGSGERGAAGGVHRRFA